MEVVKKTDKYTIEKKRSGRFSVFNSSGKNINGDDKVTILVKEGFIKQSVAAPAKEEAPAVEEVATEKTPAE